MGDIVITPASNDVNSTAGTLIVRTSDLRPISLRTNDTNRLYIDPTGKIAVNHTDAAAYASQFAIESSLTRGLTVFNPALTNGNTFFGLGFGSNNTNYDSAYLGFARVGGGSTSNYLSFSLYNQNEILNINGFGRVGIGTTSPVEKFQVSGNVIIGEPVYNSTYGQYLRFPFSAGNLTTGTLRGYIQFDSVQDYSVNSDDAWKWKFGAVARVGNGGNYNSQLEILRTTRNGVTDFTDFIISNAGYVGIGTVTANHKLDVNLGIISSNPTSFGYNVFGNAVGNVGYCGYNLQLNNSTANATAYLRLARTSSTAYLGLELASQSRDGIRFLTDATTPVEVARITAGGNVGIGITNPSSKLYVSAGTVALNGRAMYINADITTNVNVYTHTLNLIDSTNDSNPTSFALGTYSHAVLRNRAEPAGGAGGILDIYTRVISGDPTVKMTVTSSGTVGIGTVSPYSLLDIQLASASPRYATLSTNDGQGSFGGFGLNFRIANQNHDIAQIRGDYESSAGGGYGGLFFATRYSGALTNKVAFNDNGRVGIGVSYASTLLSVGGPGSTVAASGITLGADSVANLYRSQASQIKTDAQLVAVGGFYSSNTSNYLETVNIGTSVIIEGGVNEGLFLGDSSRWYIGTTDAAYTANADGDLHFRDATNSITRMIISYANGNVGIGVTNPIERLHVFGNIQLSGSSGGSLNINTNNAGNGNISFDGSTFTIVSNSNSAPLIFSTTSTERMRIQANGRVGISTNSALAQLHVSGQTYLNNVVANTARNQLTFNANGTNYAHFYDVGVSANNAIALGGNGAIGTVPTKAIMSWRLSTENVGIGLTNPEATSALHIKNLDAAAKVTIESADASESLINFSAQSSEYSVGFVRDGSNVNSLRFCAADNLSSNEVMRLQNTNVGIGTTNPNYKLDVAGAIAMYDENQDIDSRFYGGTFLRGWSSFFAGSEANITYTTDTTCPIGVEVASVSSYVWARGPKIRLDRTQNYEVELWVKRHTANTSASFYVVISNYDSNGNFISGDGTDWSYPIYFAQSSLTTGTWYKYRFIVGPYGGVKDHASNAKYISVGFIANYDTGTDVIYMTGFKCRPIPRYNNDNLTLFNDGRVGIGTTQPTGVLHLYGNSTTWQTSPSIVMASSSTVNANIRNWRVGPADTSYGNFHIGVSDVQGGTVDSNAEAQAFTITYDQKVGLGTYIPTNRLHVYNSAGSSTAASNAIALFEQNSNAGIQVAVPDASEAGLFFSRNGAAYYTAITRNGTDLLFKNNSLTRMTINNAGNVGIGIASPSTLLSVGGAGSTLAASGITFGGDAQVNLYRSAEDTLRTDAAFTNGNITLLGGDLLFANDGGGDGFQFDYYQGKMYIGNYGGTAWHMVIQDNGYVGIGTTQPTGKLHIVSSVAGETVFRADGTNGTLLSVVDDLSDSLFSVNNGAGLPVLEVFADDRIVAGQYGSGDFVLANNKIGIGTTNPINKLSVIGAASIGSTTYNTVAPANGLIVQGIVGIGLTNPTQKLHVKSSVSQDGVMIDALQYSEVAFRVNGSASKSFLALTSIAGGYVVGSSVNSFIIRNDTDIFMTADAGATSNITIKNNGNVGIGLTNPSVRLEVLSTAVTIANLGSNQTSQLVYIGNSSATQYSDLILRANDGQAEFFRGGNGYTSWGGASALNIYNSNGPIAFHPNATTNAMFLSSAGYLGIATTVPAEKLDVRGGVIRSNARITNDQGFPVGHHSAGETVFEIDPTWSQLELQKYFNSTAFTWVAVADAPGGYCIYVDGPVNVGGFANSGFPYIPVDTNDIFYMECWIQNVGTNQGHYMGSQEFDHTFANLGGNPGSYGYWVMSNYNPTTTWTKVSGYITGFSNTIGQFKAGTKYWTPQALFNYTAGTGTRACRISGWKVIKVSHVGDRSFAGNVNVASDLYVADELAVGLPIAAKRVNYGAQINAASASIQLVFGRSVTSLGSGAIGADENNTFGVYNVSGGITKQFSVTQQGNVGIGNINPTSRLTIGTNFASVKGISVSTDNFGSAQFVARKDVSKTAYGILAWDTSVYLSAGIYYDGSTWVHHNANNNNQLFTHVPGGGIQWYASNDGAGSWNVANAVTLWDDGARWKSSVRATRLEDSYITGGNFALGTDSPSSRLTVLGPALTAATKNTYAAAVGNLNNVDLTFGADNSYAYIQSWGSKPLYINNQGNNVLVNANIGIGTISPSGRLHINTASYNSSNRPFIVNNGVQTENAKLYDTAVIQQDDVTTLRLVERNPSVANQILSFSIGDGFARIACTAQPMQFWVNGGDAAGDYGYLGLNGTKAIDISTSANVGIGNVTPNGARVHIKTDNTNPSLRIEDPTILGPAGGTAGKTFAGWLPIMTGANAGDKVFIPLYK